MVLTLASLRCFTSSREQCHHKVKTYKDGSRIQRSTRDKDYESRSKMLSNGKRAGNTVLQVVRPRRGGSEAHDVRQRRKVRSARHGRSRGIVEEAMVTIRRGVRRSARLWSS